MTNKFVCDNCHAICEVGAAETCRVCGQMICGNCGSFCRRHALTMAEASPDLLEVLEEITRNIDISTINQSKRSVEKWGELVVKARAAIAKAKGE